MKSMFWNAAGEKVRIFTWLWDGGGAGEMLQWDGGGEHALEGVRKSIQKCRQGALSCCRHRRSHRLSVLQSVGLFVRSPRKQPPFEFPAEDNI